MATAYHLLVDLWGIPEGRAYLLRYPAPALALMESIRRSIGMEALGKPFVVYADGADKAWGPGVTILMPLQDSHMSLHCLEEERKAHFDLFSCKEFDWQDVVKLLRETYQGHGRAVLIKRHNLEDTPAEMIVETIRW